MSDGAHQRLQACRTSLADNMTSIPSRVEPGDLEPRYITERERADSVRKATVRYEFRGGC
ncbi:MAG: hypothetical protein EOS09_19190 [Mesorhizobium sp.]|nr:MAG: hypothetical protein EOS09_19190 [Mesorhizobium sp.]